MALQQNDKITVHTDRALPLHTVLSQRYELMRHVRSDEEWIVYHAKEIGTDKEIRIAEFLPKQAVQRSAEGNHVVTVDEKSFSSQKKSVLTQFKALIDGNVPHLYTPYSFFDENQTLYFVLQYADSVSLEESDVPITAGYLHSLALMLCDTYAALHSCGFCYGLIAEKDILLHSDGSFCLASADHLKRITSASDVSQDMYMLSSFLSDLFLLVDSETKSETLPSPYTLLKHVLQHRYHSAPELKTALIASDGSLHKPVGSVTSGKSLFRTFLCIVCLLIAAAVPVMAVIKGLPLGTSMTLGLVHPDIISVWMPISEVDDEEKLLSMYQRLTHGFEKKYKGYGINLVIFADDSFSEALLSEENRNDLPTVFMNTQHDTVMSMASDLSQLTRSLPKDYLLDMKNFKQSIPLGYSLPALFYNTYSCNEIEAQAIELSDVNPTICYDARLTDFIQVTEKSDLRKVSEFSVFVDSRSERPFLATTECLSIAENHALASGAIRMIPVSVDNKYPVLYEMYCTVNAEKDWNSRCIGMLWLQYLLTEEAQQIMFAENYSLFPIHEDVLQQTIDNHESLSIISEIQSDFRTTPLH